MGTFDTGQNQMMQLWGDTDGTYYTANWNYHTVTKKKGLSSETVWSTSFRTQMSGWRRTSTSSTRWTRAR